MLEWLECWYRVYFYGLLVLLDNPGGFEELEFMRYFTYAFLAFVLLRLLFHSVVLFRLKRSFPLYTEESHPRLWELYTETARSAGLKRLPQLHIFKNCKPMVFTAGTIKPSIFLAPELTQSLSGEELKAVLMHEMVHVKRKDNLYLLLLDSFLMVLAILFLQVYAFRYVHNAAVSVAAVGIILLFLFICRKFIWKFVIDSLEISCDEICVRFLGDPLLLADSLVKVWKTGKKLPVYRWKYSFAANGFLFFSTALERRLKKLVYYKRPRLKKILSRLSFIVFLAMLVSVSLSAWHFHTTTTNVHWDKRGHIGVGYPHFCCNECYDWHKHNSR